jgi:hypothetical protein
MAEQKTADYFGTYLDALKQHEERPGEVNDRLRSLLTTLQQSDPRPLWELHKELNLGFAEFSSELDAARASGYVEVEGPSGEERVRLTDAGRELASRLT